MSEVKEILEDAHDAAVVAGDVAKVVEDVSPEIVADVEKVVEDVKPIAERHSLYLGHVHEAPVKGKDFE